MIRAYDDNGNVVDLVEWENQIREEAEDRMQKILDDEKRLSHKQGKADMIDEVSRAMYHQCFECNNDENMQKWDSGNWFRYKLFENVIEQLKEQADENTRR